MEGTNCCIPSRPTHTGSLSATSPLLSDHSMPLMRQVRIFLQKTSICSKPIIMCLLWELTTGLAYNLFCTPTSFIQYLDTQTWVIIMGLLALVFLISPLAGYLADVKFGRFNMLLKGSFLMLASIICLVFVMILLLFTVHNTSYYFYMLLLAVFVIGLTYSCGRMMFIANILQFVMDQLRDAPTQDSVLFLYLYYWSNSFSAVIGSSMPIPGHTITLKIEHNYPVGKRSRIIIDLLFGLLSFSIMATIIVVYLLHKKKNWFVTEKIAGNPYKLVYQVVQFACRNKTPLRRSAFTYCEDERLSRLDYGKQRYGGPFTTEQVEDVKVLFHMLKVLVSLGPAFMLNVAVTSLIMRKWYDSEYERDASTSITMSSFILLHRGMLAPLLILIFIPIYLAFKHTFPRCFPNMFKRMGLGIILLCISILLLLVYDIVSISNSINLSKFSQDCTTINATYVINHNILRIPMDYMLVIQHTLSALHQSLIYTAAWEFICSQSPQHLKGTVFGLFYAIQAFYQFLAVMLMLPFLNKSKSHLMDCRSIYSILMLGIGVLAMIVYTMMARKYRYRKRDDICNIYQYAENYYCNTGEVCNR